MNTNRQSRLCIRFSLTLTIASVLLHLPCAGWAHEPITIHSDSPAKSWQQAMIGGNGDQGMMVWGKPQNETVVINHTQCWVPAQPVAPDVPDIVDAFKKARELIKVGKHQPAVSTFLKAYYAGNKEMFPEEALVRKGPRLGLNYVHPVAYLKIETSGTGQPKSYRRSLTYDSGEIVTSWTDDAGDWKRDAFVSRPRDAIVMRLRRLSGAGGSGFTGTIRLTERPGYDEADIATPVIQISDDEIYLKSYYKKLHGLDEADGYHTMLRVIAKSGSVKSTDGGIQVTDAEEVLLLQRTAYLPAYSAADRQTLRQSLDAIPTNYPELLAEHTAVHGEMFNRVRLDLGGNYGGGRSTEEIIAEAESKGPTSAFLELIHASGRYCLISSSGALPPTLMGIWGDTWEPRWWGHYTLDSNLQLAISNGSVGNLPEAMDSYFSWIESLYPDWERNAKRIYGARGYLGSIAHGWRHGKVIAGWHEWTGCAPWMATFFWQYYLFTNDEEFLRERAVPLLENVTLFYEDFLAGTDGKNGKFLVFPSISPENTPTSPKIKVTMNATSELALIRETIGALIKSYEVLNVKQDRIPELKAFLEKVPEYHINEDGALAEWSHPDIKDNYNHRHNSHLIALYPGVSINPKTPRLYNAAKNAIRMRREAGQGNKSAHGYMELGFAGSRLQSPEIVWTMLDDYAREKFIYPSFISSHNPNHNTYNLDSILALPAIMTEMVIYSRPGELNLLPGVPLEHLPKGSISGVLARKGIVINNLSWDHAANRIRLEMTSKSDQRVAITSRLGIASIEGESIVEPSDEKNEIELTKDKRQAFDIMLGS